MAIFKMFHYLDGFFSVFLEKGQGGVESIVGNSFEN
jgi:hypothetical protein